MADFGRLLTVIDLLTELSSSQATEIRSTQKYWQIMPDSNVYSDPFRNNTIVGILWSLKADYATFFGGHSSISWLVIDV